MRLLSVPTFDTTERPSRTGRSRIAAAALSGVLAAATSIAIGQLVAAVVAPTASPLLAVGSTLIDLTPEWLKSFAIQTFGTQDKVALLVGIIVVLAIGSVAIGLVGMRSLGLAMVAIGMLGVVGASAVSLRPAASIIDVLPAVVGTLAGMAVLIVLEHKVSDDRAARLDSPIRRDIGFSRRRFVIAATGVVALIAISGGLAAAIGYRRAAFATGATGPVIPAPLEPLAPVADGVDLAIADVSPFITPNEQFYRVDTALQVPVIAPDDWHLRIHGMVDREVVLTLADLLQYPTIERDITLTCVSNQVGGGYAGTARWTGISLATVLEAAGVQGRADQIVSRSIDGMSIGTPTSIALDGRDAMLAVAMNGVPLPIEHGYPVRLIVPGLYGYVSATKWLVELELTTFDAYDPYWVQRGWSKQGPIKTMSRIDAPKPLARIPAGRTAIAGVAWAQHTGISRVEVRVDGGAWTDVRLAVVDTLDTWRQWVHQWDAASGNHTLEVRATDASGHVQPETRAEPFPNGATGWHSVVVSVT